MIPALAPLPPADVLERMFTGIIEETGRVLALSERGSGWRLEIAAQAALVDVAMGDSIAVNGCCLTVVAFAGDRLVFDVLHETWRLTNFAQLQPDAAVNLERSLRFGGKMGGHFVTGHIDGLGYVEEFEQRGTDHYLRVRGPAGSAPRLVHKGSIAIDGISLTVAETRDDEFSVWLIPHTLAVTNLREKRVGDGVNLEFDLLGKYVEKLVSLHALPTG